MITLILGPMYAGKSSELIRLVRRHHIAKKDCLIVKYSKDDRYECGNNVYTHDGICTTNIKAITCPKIIDIDDILTELTELTETVVCFDEGQFFENLKEICLELCRQNVIIYISALNSDYRSKMFPSIVDILPHCENIKFLNSVCSECMEETAIYSKRMSEQTEIEIIGGKELYSPLCKKCFL